MAAKGCKKNGGRAKGTPNKRELFSVHDRLREIGYDLVGEIIRDLAEITKPDIRLKFHLQLLEYCDAKRKAIEIDDKTAVSQIDEDMKQKSTEELLKLINENKTDDNS